MNKTRRQQLRKWLVDLEEIKSELESIVDDEQDYFDNMPENLQGSQRGMDAEEAIDHMSEAVSSIEEAIGIIEDIVYGGVIKWKRRILVCCLVFMGVLLTIIGPLAIVTFIKSH